MKDDKQYKEQQESELDVLEDDGCKLIVHNDDYHTFDYVKTGGYEDLLPMHTALLNKQLTSEIIQ